jgi:alcohol dehydrogenase
MSFYQFFLPTKIIFDEGISRNFSHECQQLGLGRVLVVTDAHIRGLGLCEPILQGLRDGGVDIVGVFDEVPPDSSLSAVKACAAKAKEAGALGLVAIGGGSVLDTAKAANVLFTLGGDFKEDYAGSQTITQKLSPLVAIPTTAGTGCEVTGAVVIFDEETQTKMSLQDEHLCPALAVLDPQLTLRLPPRLTAATALDALTHAIEAVLSVQRGSMSDALAMEAIKKILNALPRVLQNPQDAEGRADLLVAANLAGIAFHHAMVGVVHAVAHAVGATLHAHHGEACAVFLPFGLEYNFETSLSQIVSLAEVFGVVFERDETITAHKVINALRSFLKRVHDLSGIPLSYREMGMREEHLPKIVELAVQ